MVDCAAVRKRRRTMDIAAFILASLALIAKPGPDAMFLLATTLERGRAAGLAAMCGLIAGCAAWIVLLACGVDAFFGAHPAVFQAVRAGGVMYILYLAAVTLREGWREIKGGPDVPASVRVAAAMAAEAAESAEGARPRPEPARVAAETGPSAARSAGKNVWQVFLRGIFMAMANPLTVFFFLSFLPRFVSRGGGTSAAAQTLFLGAVFCALVPLFDVPAVFAAGWLHAKAEGNSRLGPAVKIASGAILLAIAFLLAMP